MSPSDPANPAFYHLIIDPTVLAGDAVVEVLTTAVESFWTRLN